jgi:hypothetical protein
MLLGALLDAGLSLEALQADLARLSVSDYRLSAERVTRHGLTGTLFQVLLSGDPGQRPARTLPAIEAILSQSDLPERVRANSLAVFRRLALAEAAVHGTTVDHIHFHEIGAIDSLVDIVGFACALERLGIEAIYSSALPLGGGTVETEHGLLPVPAPAAMALIAQKGAPTVPGPGEGELVTPTGAALLTEFARFEQPAMAPNSVGYGFGSKERAWANCLRVWLGEAGASSAPPDSDEVVEMACNLDDATGQALGHAMERLLAEGALDVWFTPIQMKKNRPATMLSLLARPEDSERLASLLLRETPTLGVRQRLLARTKAGREARTANTPWGPVRVKVKLLQGQIVAASPEYDDCVRLAASAGVPLAEVMDAARCAAENN